MKFFKNMAHALRGCLEDEELMEYSLDGLEGKARAKAEEHLKHCQRCREQVREFKGLGEGLALLAPQVEPPCDLADNVLKKVADMKGGRG